MNLHRLRNAPNVFCAGCLAVTAVILAWPAHEPAAPAKPRSPKYRGVDHRSIRASMAAPPAFTFSVNAAEEAAAPSASALHLVGIAGARAWLRSSTSGEVTAVRAGDDVDGWRILGVAARSVTVRGPGGEQRLTLFSPAPVASAAPAAGSDTPPGLPTTAERAQSLPARTVLETNRGSD